MSKLNEQFDVLANTLRLLPEAIVRLNYFIREIGEPEEGISNIELACVNVFNNLYGMMSALKDEGVVTSIYEHDAITTILCIRHVLAHQSGRLKNNLRDAWSESIPASPTLIKYNVSDPAMPDTPLYINVAWFQDGIAKNAKISKRLATINSFWKLDTIKQQVEASSRGNWAATYMCAMAMITEAVRTLVAEYGNQIVASGHDSNVYLEHFTRTKAVNTSDYGLIT
ncbi:MAG: hypothetical protein V4706_17350 [Pseudomonadota bacterium]